MESQSIFAALRDALAALYLEEQEARLLTADAGLALTLIPFHARARLNWHPILTVALLPERLAAPPSINKYPCFRSHQSMVGDGLMG